MTKEAQKAPSASQTGRRLDALAEGGSPVALRQRTIRDRLRREWWIYLFLAPMLIGFGMYTIYPILASWWYSFLDWDGFALQGTFIGLDNYRRVVQDDLFWNAFSNSFVFLLVAVPVRVGLALFLAIVLNSKITPLRGLFRTLLFVPVVTTGAIVGVVFTLILDPNGPVNVALEGVGLIDQPITFLGNPDTSLFSGVGVWVWKWLGITLIYWLAALQTIPQELYEAARTDGASNWQQFRYVTFPHMVPFLIIIMLIDIEEALNVFDLLLTLTGGGPAFSSEVIEIYIYRTAFEATTPQLGYASAAAVFFGLTTLILVLLQGAGLRIARGRLRSS